MKKTTVDLQHMPSVGAKTCSISLQNEVPVVEIHGS